MAKIKNWSKFNHRLGKDKIIYRNNNNREVIIKKSSNMWLVIYTDGKNSFHFNKQEALKSAIKYMRNNQNG